MYLMFTLRLSLQLPDTVFVLLYQTQTRLLSHKSLLKWGSLKFLLYPLFLCCLIERYNYCEACVLYFPKNTCQLKPKTKKNLEFAF